MVQRDNQVILDPEILTEKPETTKIKLISKPKGFKLVLLLPLSLQLRD